MGKFLILVLVALALVQLTGATEQEAEKQISLLENQGDLQIQELADPKRRKKEAGGKKKKGRKNGKRNKKTKKVKKARKGGKGGKKTNSRKKQNRKQRKRQKKQRKAEKKQQKKNRKRRKGKKSKTRRNGNGNSRKTSQRQAGCEAGCSELLVGMMKAARKQNTYLKQFNRIVNGQKQAAKKGLKKDDFDSNSTEGPLGLLIAAGGGNASELTCAGSKTNKKAIMMANLTATLAACKTDLGSKCNTSAFSVIKPEWSACNSSMLAFKDASDACMKLAGPAACECFNATATVDLQKKVENCSATEMAAASASDGKLKKACIKVYGACRKDGESIRPVLAACQPGGATSDEMKKDLGNVLKNDAATTAVTDKIDAVIASAGRKTIRAKRAVSLGGVDYETDTCALWTTLVTAFLDAILASASTDVSAAGTEIVSVVVTCTAADLGGLQAAKAKGATAKSQLAKKKAALKKNLESLTGETLSDADLAGIAAATTAAPAGGAVTKAMRRRNKILAEFRQRL